MDIITILQLLIIVILYTLSTSQVEAQIIDDICSQYPNCMLCANEDCLQCNAGFDLSSVDNCCTPTTKILKAGEYFDDSSQKYLSCFPTCETCRGPSNYQCLSCISGYSEIKSFSDMFMCTKCEVNYCSRCDIDGKCLECNTTYYLNLDTNQCSTCKVANCLSCVSDSICTLCNQGYLLSDDQTQCVLDSSSICSMNKCKCCTNGRCNQCEDGYYIDKNGSCSPCQQECSTCLGENNCTSCKKLNNEYFLQGNKCIGQCHQNFYAQKSSKKCIECSKAMEGCLTCIDDKKCTQCIDNINYSLQNNICVKKCKPQEFIPMDNIQQIQTLQKKRYWELINTNLIKSCQNCLPEILSVCKLCIGLSSYCDVCQDIYYQYKGKCLSSCPSYTYPNVQLKKCFNCMEGCKKCQNGYSCQECNEGFIFNQQFNQCMFKNKYVLTKNPKKCPINYVFFDGYCMVQCPFGTIKVDNKCQSNDSCNVISFDITNEQTFCLQCKNQYQFQYQGYCLDDCPYFTTFVSKNGICQPQCDSITLLQDGQQPMCVDSCSSKIYGYPQIQKQYCLQTQCNESEFFGKKGGQYEQSMQNLPCKKCHESCLICSGSAQSDCLQCKQGYVYQEYFLEEALLNQNNPFQDPVIRKPSYYLCQLACNPGYRVDNNICIKCQNKKECSQCRQFDFVYNDTCVENCISIPQTIEKVKISSLDNNLCIIKQGLILEASCSKKINNICMFAKYITVQVTINGNVPYSSFIKCQTSDNKILDVNFNKNTKKYDITGFSDCEKKFSVICSLVYQNALLYTETTGDLDILEKLDGDFSTSITSGTCGKDKVYFSLKNWSIPNLKNKQLNYYFSISARYINLQGREQTLEIKQVNQYLNSDLLPQYTNQMIEIKDQFDLPLINVNQLMRIQAVVYVDIMDEELTNSAEINFQIKKNKEISQNIIQYNNQDRQRDIISYILDHFSVKKIGDPSIVKQISEIFDYVDSRYNQDLEIERDVNTRKTSNFGFSKQFMSCDNAITCNSNGTCQKDAEYYEQCICSPEYTAYFYSLKLKVKAVPGRSMKFKEHNNSFRTLLTHLKLIQ